MKPLLNLALISATLLLPTYGQADTVATSGQLTLSYSDGRPATTGVDEVNAVLHRVGVRVTTPAIPEAAKSILKASHERAITEVEAAELISTHFSLDRGELLDQIRKAGRKPEAPNGGYLSTSEGGNAPYPKVYDMQALSPEVKAFIQEKFGKLHVNRSENGMGIDEVMTIVSGGPWTWFFSLPDNVVGKLTLGHVGLNDKAWRISYPGLGPHGGYLDAEYGLVVAYAHGPDSFVIRYEDSGIEGAELLNTNPWIDLSGQTPKLLDTVSGE